MSDAGTGDAGIVVTDSGVMNDWTSLWNGVDFTGWQRWLGSPSVGQPVFGLENDPRAVFSVVQLDGEPAIHITGEVWGALTSLQSYDSFELEAEYRWGTHVWPPLNFFDSGLMYLSSGDFGSVNAGGNAMVTSGTGSFMVSMEYQLAPGDIGGMYNLGPISFTPGTHTASVEQSGWNQIHIVVRSDLCEHYLNGQLVRSATGGFTLHRPGEATTSLATGRLQLQSEGGEIYFRHLRVRSL